MGSNGLVNTPCGSPCYASPECLSGRQYNGKTNDVWSCGVILFAMVTGQLPWTKRNQNQLFDQIRKGEYKIPSFVSPECASFIKGLLKVDNTKRLTIEKALKHPWLESTTSINFTPVEYNSYVSIRKIDEFFGVDKDGLSDIGPQKLKRTNSKELITFSQSVKEIQKCVVKEPVEGRKIVTPTSPRYVGRVRKIIEPAIDSDRRGRRGKVIVKDKTENRPSSTTNRIIKPKTTKIQH